MKTLILLLLIVTSGPAFSAPVLTCRTVTKVDGWTGGATNEYVYLTAKLRTNTLISGARINGAYLSDSKDLKADLAYRPRSPSYQNFNRFEALGDAWHLFLPLLPKNLSDRQGYFTGFIHVMDEEGYKETLRLRCLLQR